MPALVLPVDLGPGASAFFTGRDAERQPPAIGDAGNLSHRRPHVPDDLAHARREVGEATGTDPERWHLMQQVHGGEVATVDATVPVGAELRQVDGAVTSEVGRTLAVLTADCVPVLLAGPTAVGVAHAGRAGVVAGIVPRTLTALARLGSAAPDLRVAIGPAIGGCCYEVPEDLRAAVADRAEGASATTTWGTPSLDLPRAVHRQLEDAGVTAIAEVGGCTRCDADVRWFSHRRDAAAGRQAGLITRTAVAA